ncbi:hypothetical protein RvY_03342 [Ramazzottius varieornatus]|uniref:Uncharacterized protein n=1 Tax=Ramazzottius varieornatus TaxID=947166 RepID=A0A1D1UMR8_RAMVA|nr:hypothetical protein RvY_03342 [Ramazzottius varieornatus]
MHVRKPEFLPRVSKSQLEVADCTEVPFIINADRSHALRSMRSVSLAGPEHPELMTKLLSRRQSLYVPPLQFGDLGRDFHPSTNSSPPPDRKPTPS